MDIVKLAIPYGFLRQRIPLTWGDVLFGIDNGLIAPDAAPQLAADQLASNERADRATLELASEPASHHRSLVEQLASKEPATSPGTTEAKWLFVTLAWIYDHRDNYDDPLLALEEVYADFGYPDTIAHLVRYMPSAGPDLGSVERNEERLFRHWKQFLDDSMNRRW